MGGSIFKAPKVHVPDDSAEKEAEEKAKQDALDRQRRGMGSTIKTSNNGILGDETKGEFKRKKLLGE